ncbi:hypothetical protein FRX31_030654 [Thalictrum thalictroides]|uniref:Uncharacterized protein n=1 Tax=Thalictrum thalictroides TaxID=46969 RepID=A0A7J6V6E0_THATH|nr:hypothetical protein FRX31_030654 [Thalictrum thalictroides]
MLTPIVFEVVKRRLDRCKHRIGGKIMNFTPLDVTLIHGLRIDEFPNEFVLRKKKDEPSVFKWMKEIEADAVSESFTSIPNSSSTHGNFDAEGLKNIIGLISYVVNVEGIAEELGKKFEIVPKKSSPKKKKKTTP